MSDKLHRTPSENFPEDLSEMPDAELQVLDSQIQRQMDREIVREGEADSETEFRHYQLDDEFSDRDER
jgi:hypothetical protein